LPLLFAARLRSARSLLPLPRAPPSSGVFAAVRHRQTISFVVFFCRACVIFPQRNNNDKGGLPMADDVKPLLIKRYASRRLYNTETAIT
jgi:hypothetical protein